MTDEPSNLILQYLRRIDAKVDALQADMIEVKQRLSLVEEGLAIVNKRLDRLDRLEVRVDRIERRLGMADA